MFLLYIYHHISIFTVNQENPKGGPNLFIWKAETGQLEHSYIHKKQMNWCVNLSQNETSFRYPTILMFIGNRNSVKMRKSVQDA